MTQDEIAAQVQNQLDNADSSMTGLQGERNQALNYYFTRPRGDEIPGRSSIQSADLADMVEAVVAQLVPSFAGDEVAVFEPNDSQDEAAAQMESLAVNQAIAEDNPGFQIISSAIKDALLLSVGVVKAWVDEYEATTTRRYPPLDDAQLSYLTASQPGRRASVVKGEEGYEVSFTGTRQVIKLAAVNPANFWVNADHTSMDLADASFVAERKFPTRGELKSLGFKKADIERLETYSTDSGGFSTANSSGYQYQGVSNNFEYAGWGAERVQVYECYLRMDKQGNGNVRLYRVLYGFPGVVLECEPAPRIPYAIGSAILVPHRWYGMSLFLRLKSVQDGKTQVLRQMVDNLLTNNYRQLVVVDGEVNADDLANPRPGGIVRAHRLDAVMPIEVTDLGQSSQAALNYFDKMRSERGGASLDLQTAEMQIAGDTAHGTERQMSSREQMASLFARNLSETLIRSLYVLVHATMRDLSEPLMVQFAGQWQQISPGQWPERTRVNVTAGLSPGERNRKAQTLMALVQVQQGLLQSGSGVAVVDFNNIYRALQDWLRASGIENPERYLIHPQSPQAQQAMAGQAQQAQEQQQQQAQLAQMQMQLEQQKLELDKYKHDSELRFKYWDARLDAEVKEAEMTVKAMDTDKETEADAA